MKDCRQPRPNRPIVVWFRDDQRLADHPALAHAAASGRPIVCVYVHDPLPRHGRPLGAAACWWLHESLRELDRALQSLGAGLVLLRGEEQETLLTFAAAIEAAEVCWNRRYSPAQRHTDLSIKSALEARAVSVSTFNGHLLCEPWNVATKSGAPFQVFGAYWRTAREHIADELPRPSPDALEPFPLPMSASVRSVDLAALKLQPESPDWAAGLREAWACGESGAQERLRRFVTGALNGYATERDTMARDTTSQMSPYLRFGNVSARQLWYAVAAAAQTRAVASEHARKFQDELGWREFSYHLLYHFAPLHQVNFRPQFDAMPWRADRQALRAWQRGRTGYPLVDAGMRQLWRTGWMHNRARMVTASFLVKHLLIDWREGESWFWDTLVDADEANNPASWQWVAGSGADAAPYFRIFNPVLQGQKFDPQGDYIRRWLPELHRLPTASIHAPWQAAPDQLAAASVRLGESYPLPIVGHQQARVRALHAFATLRGERGDAASATA
jgi:deoxyribodipyrimidine photo-lyase